MVDPEDSIGFDREGIREERGRSLGFLHEER